jgi:autotransporter-associated beta strand protein
MTCCLPRWLISPRTTIFVALFVLVSRVSALDFASGADISWLPQMEAAGVVYRYDDGTPGDLIHILKSKGFNSIRLRTWVNPSNNRCSGHCSQAETIAMAQRVKNAGMRVMINFHYGDTWNDVGNQNPPAAWRNMTYEQMRAALGDYTLGFCVALKAAGVTPEWIQLGNETDLGICGPTGHSVNNPAQMTGLLMAGYNAVKSVFPETSVLLHVGGPQRPETQAMIDAYRAHGGQWDITGYSSYASGSAIAGVQAVAASWVERYGKPIMQLEVGGQVTAVEDTKSKVQQCLNALKSLGTNGRGIFYWEPATNLCNYTMHAWDSATQKATAVLDPFNGAGTPLKPLVPQGLSTSLATPQVSLQWKPSPSATHYRIRRSTTKGGPYAEIAPGVPTTSYLDADVDLGVTYYYVLSAHNAIGESDDSAEIAATPLAGPVTAIWGGDGVDNVWATGGPANWRVGADAVPFVIGYDAVFDGTGSTSPAVNLTEPLLPRSVVVNSSQDYSLTGSGSLTGTMVLSKAGSGTFSLGTANTFLGDTQVTDGTLQLAHTLALQASTVQYGGGTITFSEITNATLGGLAGSRDLNLMNAASAPVTLTIGNNNSSTTYSGGFGGPGSVIKQGTGTLTLDGTHAIGGGLRLVGGALHLVGGAISGNGALSLEVRTNFHVTDGAFTWNGSGYLASGTVVISGGDVAFNGGLGITGNGDVFFTQSGGNLTASQINVERSSDGTINYARGLVFTGGTATLGALQLGSLGSNGIASIEGGAVRVTGPVIIGSQTLAGRGGAMRITSGRFSVDDTSFGLVLSRVNGTNANNVTQANFLGGVSKLGRITFGYNNAVNAGSGTVRINGGTVYIGSGGIVKNGTTGMTSSVAFTTGILGASSNWTTTHNIALSGAATFQAADESDAPFNITLDGVLSGAGSVTKTGDGMLVLNGLNTYTGATTVEAGTLSGRGRIAGPLVLNGGGAVVPGSAGGATFSGSSMTWNPEGSLGIDLLTGTRLALTGALTVSGSGARPIVLQHPGPIDVGSVFTLATFGSTNAAPSDFIASAPHFYSGDIVVNANSLQFVVTAEAPEARYTYWADDVGLPPESSLPHQDADNDGIPNLVEFALAGDALQAGGDGVALSTVVVEGEIYPIATFVRRTNIGGAVINVRVSRDLTFSSDLGATLMSSVPNGDGTETVVYRSNVPLSTEASQFLRVFVSLPTE